MNLFVRLSTLSGAIHTVSAPVFISRGVILAVFTLLSALAVSHDLKCYATPRATARPVLLVVAPSWRMRP